LEVKKDILWRVYLGYIGIVVLSLMILGRAAYIQQVEGSFWRGKSDSLHQKFVDLAAERGTIYSEDRSMLSTSVPFFDIYIDFAADGLRENKGKRFKENLEALSASLANHFADHNKAWYKKMLQQGYQKKDRYFSLKKNISFEDYKMIRSFPLIKLGKNKSGFIAEVKTRRLNPFGLLANRTIGLARENAQNVGIERTYDNLLRGEQGSKLVRFIAGGVAVPVEGYEVDPENGKDIITTLDVNIQDIAENALLKMMVENECEHGTCIVMEVATGKVKAIANLGRRSTGNYWEDLNYAIRASEPGSTFKLATMLAVLEDKHVKLNDVVNLEGGRWSINRRTVFDSETHGLYDVSIQKAFEHSSNVGMAKLAVRFYSGDPAPYLAHLKKLHFTEPSGLGLIGETNPIIKNPKSKTWSATTLPWMAFGYEVLVSPMQTLMLYNAVANNGRMMKPYIVEAIEKDGLVDKKIEPEVIEEAICSEETLRQLRICLEGVMTNGTGRELQNPLFTIGGKTGTALVANGKKGYADHIYQSSFAGYFPADKPKYSCIVVIKNKPFARRFYGAAVAGPVFKEVADKLYALHVQKPVEKRLAKIVPDSSRFYYSGETADMKFVLNSMKIRFTDSSMGSNYAALQDNKDFRGVMQAKLNAENLVPDLSGMGLKDALYLAESMNLTVKSQGKGKIVSQTPKAGEIMPANKTIVLELGQITLTAKR
jgi:cell division protein FtsI (penicillin-binding protein 3)